MPSKKLDAKADAEELKPKMTKEMSARAKQRLRQQQKAKEMKYAKELFAQGVSRAKIAEKLGRSRVTIGKWVKDEPDPNKLRKLQEEQEDASLAEKELDQTGDSLVEDVPHEFIDARTEEDEALLEMSKQQSTPADQYQAFAASKVIQMIRDNFNGIRPPRTIAELDRLDQIARRNLGINPKGAGGGGSSTLQIDINLLNNHKATPPKGVTIDVDPKDE